MIGAPGGSLDFAGQYAIVSPTAAASSPSTASRSPCPPQGDGYPGLMAAHARAIDALADRIAASITGRAPGA